MIQISQTELKRGLKLVKHAMNRSHREIKLRGVHIQAAFGAVIFTATDGHRAARYVAEGTGDGELFASQEEVRDLSSGTLSLDAVSKKSYTFPNAIVSGFFSNPGSARIVGDRKKLIDELKGLDTIILRPQLDGTPLIRSRPFSILPLDSRLDNTGLNAKYLRTILLQASGETVVLNYTGVAMVRLDITERGMERLTPLRWEPMQITFPDDARFFGVIMPLRIDLERDFDLRAGP